ncbi:AraC family transcriptional regulator [Clostridium lacusfryxellense]|uniref:AraC family transcriptional regulator n=1 Tax=Clostridium lacusfryxellense TaxID=205328 RepID=UPI001C0B4FD2|nr:AraC family transcriptional regulator [Clostridium lacusfryxellense]MBU3113295.1 AraC family transcriptional regulator [Clostridium lacusfryxellense]
MKIDKLFAKDIIDLEAEANYHIINNIENACPVHCHDFFELFIILKGDVIHNINGLSQRLSEGSMVFIRPDDIHFYEKYSNSQNQLINLAFPSSTTEALFSYLGDGFNSDNLLKSSLPQVVLLSPSERILVSKKIQSLFIISDIDKKIIKTRLRILLIELITTYFNYTNYEKDNTMPQWLKFTLTEMSRSENIRDGLKAIEKLSGRTPEHISRVFKKCVGKTPTDYVNELKTTYAANLLLHSDELVINIALESGFENLSHFYHVFKCYFKISPGKYRKENKISFIL